MIKQIKHLIGALVLLVLPTSQAVAQVIEMPGSHLFGGSADHSTSRGTHRAAADTPSGSGGRHRTAHDVYRISRDCTYCAAAVVGTVKNPSMWTATATAFVCDPCRKGIGRLLTDLKQFEQDRPRIIPTPGRRLCRTPRGGDREGEPRPWGVGPGDFPSVEDWNRGHGFPADTRVAEARPSRDTADS